MALVTPAVSELTRSEHCRLGAIEQTLLADIEALWKHRNALRDQFGKVVVFTVVTKLTGQPSAEVRARAQEMSLETANSSSVTVIMGAGLSAVLVRGFMAALALIAPNTSSQRIAKTIGDGLRLAESEVAGPVTLSEMEQAIEAFVAARAH